MIWLYTFAPHHSGSKHHTSRSVPVSATVHMPTFLSRCRNILQEDLSKVSLTTSIPSPPAFHEDLFSNFGSPMLTGVDHFRLLQRISPPFQQLFFERPFLDPRNPTYMDNQPERDANKSQQHTNMESQESERQTSVSLYFWCLESKRLWTFYADLSNSICARMSACWPNFIKASKNSTSRCGSSLKE